MQAKDKWPETKYQFIKKNKNLLHTILSTLVTNYCKSYGDVYCQCDFYITFLYFTVEVLKLSK